MGYRCFGRRLPEFLVGRRRSHRKLRLGVQLPRDLRAGFPRYVLGLGIEWDSHCHNCESVRRANPHHGRGAYRFLELIAERFLQAIAGIVGCFGCAGPVSNDKLCVTDPCYVVGDAGYSCCGYVLGYVNARLIGILMGLLRGTFCPGHLFCFLMFTSCLISHVNKM